MADEFDEEIYPAPYGDPGGNAGLHGDDYPHLHRYELVETVPCITPDQARSYDVSPYPVYDVPGARIYVRLCVHCEALDETLHVPGCTYDDPEDGDEG